jgi:hypothetical protein
MVAALGRTKTNPHPEENIATAVSTRKSEMFFILILFHLLSVLPCNLHVEAANASRQKPKPLPDSGQQTLMKQQTVMRQEYAETGDSGFVGWVASELPFSTFPTTPLRTVHPGFPG